MKENGSFRNLFNIDEEPLPLTTAAAHDSENFLEAIECDVRALMNRLAVGEHERARREEEFRDESKRVLLELIDILDAFERVFDVIRSKQDKVNRQMKKWIGNFRTVRRLLENLLFSQGARIIENLDDGFDPMWHQAVETVSDPAKPDGVIIDQVLKGYVWQNAVLRRAKVIVVRNADSGAESGGC